MLLDDINSSYSAKKALENRSHIEDDRIEELQIEVQQYSVLAEDADKKYEEVKETGSCLHWPPLL